MPSTKRIAKPAFETSAEETTIIREVKKMAVRSVYPSRLKYIGTVSGKEYQWFDAGAIVMVLSEDVPTLLEKRIGSKSCCGALSLNGNQVFELV